jgi:hypothetical protein
MFGIFNKSELDSAQICGGIADQLWTLLNTDMAQLTELYARFVLRKNSNVNFYTDKRDPKYLLGWGDLTYVFLREDMESLDKWVSDMKLFSGSQELQIVATEEFARRLGSVLIKRAA